MIDHTIYDNGVTRIKSFFKIKGFVELHNHSPLSILNACENPEQLETFQYNNQLWPFQQSSKMILDNEFLKRPVRGYFCLITNSEHKLVFDFIMNAGIQDIIALERELLEFIGFTSNYPIIAYSDNVPYYDIFFLEHFPNHMYPRWNIKQTDEQYVEQVNLIIQGVEVISAFELSTNKCEMRNKLYEQYVPNLNELFGEERVQRELDQFFNHEFVTRSCGTIDITKLVEYMNIIW